MNEIKSSKDNKIYEFTVFITVYAFPRLRVCLNFKNKRSSELRVDEIESVKNNLREALLHSIQQQKILMRFTEVST